MPLKNNNLLSFRDVRLVFPMRTLFSKRRSLIVEIVEPSFVLNESLFSSLSPQKSLMGKWEIQQVDVTNGQIFFNAPRWDVQLLHFSLRSRKRPGGTSFRLDSPHLKMILPIEKKQVHLEGALEVEFREQDANIKINRFAWQTQRVNITANGRITREGVMALSAQLKGDPRDLLYPLLREMNVAGMGTGSVQLSRSHSGNVWINGNFASPLMAIAEEPMTDIKGKVTWDNRSEEVHLEAGFRSRGFDSRLKLRSLRRVTDLEIEDASAGAAARIIKVERDVPVEGRLERAQIHIDDDVIEGRAFLNNGDFSRPADSVFKATGEVLFKKDRNRGDVTFSIAGVQTNIGELSVSGRSRIEDDLLDFHLEGDVRHLEHIAPLTRFYLNLDLAPWSLENGQGRMTLDYSKHGRAVHIHNRLQLERLLSHGETVQSLAGEVTSDGRVTRGTFAMVDPALRGEAALEVTPEAVAVDFHDVQGESHKILTILNLPLALQGPVKGAFRYQSPKGQMITVDGSFESERLAFEGVKFEQASGQLHSNLNDIRLSGLSFMLSGGKGSGDLFIDFSKQTFDISSRVQDLQIQLDRPGLQGRGNVGIKGKGTFFQDPIRVEYGFSPLSLFEDRPFESRGEALFYTNFGDFSLQASGVAIYAGAPSTYSVNMKRQLGKYSGDFTLDLRDLSLIIPWKNNTGQMRVMGQILPGPDGAPRLQGVASFSGETLAVPNFSHAIDKYQGFITFDGGQYRLQSFTGEMGGGPVQANGQVIVRDYALQDLLLYFTGRDMQLYPMDRVQCRLNADLTLRSQSRQQLLLQGNLNFLSVNWEREVDEPISFYTSSTLSPAESQILKMLRFDINLVGNDNVQMNNSLGNINARFNLHLTGTNEFPSIMGTIEGKSGEVFFSERRFNLLKGKVVFSSQFFTDPLVQLESETGIQNYRIRFDIKGTASHPKPEFSSSPPLPTQDILALISLGEIFKRSGSTEVSSQLGGSAMISSKLTEQIQNRANKLLGIDLLRIDPLMSGQSNLNAPWLTVGAGHLISKNLIVVYSQNLSTSKQQILYFQYQLSPTLSVIGMRNEEGNYSVDIRYRQRY